MDGHDAVRDVSIPASIRWLVARAVDRESVGVTDDCGTSTAVSRRKVAQFVEGFGDDEGEFLKALTSAISTWEWSRVVARVGRLGDPDKAAVVRALDLKHVALAGALAAVIGREARQRSGMDVSERLRLFEVAGWGLTAKQRARVLNANYEKLRGGPSTTVFARSLINDFFPKKKRRSVRFLGHASSVMRKVRDAAELSVSRTDAHMQLRDELQAVRRLRFVGDSVEFRAHEPEREVEYVLAEVLRLTIPDGTPIRRRLSP